MDNWKEALPKSGRRLRFLPKLRRPYGGGLVAAFNISA